MLTAKNAKFRLQNSPFLFFFFVSPTTFRQLYKKENATVVQSNATLTLEGIRKLILKPLYFILKLSFLIEISIAIALLILGYLKNLVFFVLYVFLFVCLFFDLLILRYLKNLGFHLDHCHGGILLFFFIYLWKFNAVSLP